MAATISYERFKGILIGKILEAAKWRRMMAEEHRDDAVMHMRSSADLEELAKSFERDTEGLKLSQLYAVHEAAWEGTRSEERMFGEHAIDRMKHFGIDEHWSSESEERFVAELIEDAYADLRAR